jgi:hypothetical protein
MPQRQNARARRREVVLSSDARVSVCVLPLVTWHCPRLIPSSLPSVTKSLKWASPEGQTPILRSQSMSYATGSHTVFHHRTELEELADAAKPINRHKSMKVNGALSYVDIR